MVQPICPLLLGAPDVAQLAPSLPEIIGMVEQTYRMEARGEVDIPPKVALHPHGPQSFLHAMPAWVSGAAALGMKWVSFFPGNAAHDLPTSSALIVLNDPDHGLPVAIMDGMWITNARTGACAALAAKHCANPAPRRLGLVGCGALAEWSLRCIAAVHPSIDEVFVSSARPESRRAFCAAMAAKGSWQLTPVDDVRLAVEGMDIVVSSVPKLERHPVRGDWWSPGTLMVPLDVTGAWDDAVYRVADRLVCDHRENLERALARYRPNLALDESRLVTMQDIAAGTVSGRQAPDERVLAFMTGVGSIDMTVAREIYRRALQSGRGTRFTFT